MRFWDSSAIVPLLTAEKDSPVSERMMREDGNLVVWWGSRIECMSAIARKRRAGEASEADMEAALRRLNDIEAYVSMVEPDAGVRELAELLIRRHPLGAADAFQLAAALLWTQGETRGHHFVSFDQRLREAAAREGFSIRPE